MRRRVCLWGGAAALILLCVSRPVVAQDFSDDVMETPSAGITAWCSASNGERGEFYLTAPRTLHSASPAVVGSLSGHFAQTVNARFGTHLIMSAPHCRVFRNAAASEAARAALVTRASKDALRIRDPGIF
ncbi:hypothetical protein [Acetobacter oeni]|uniref:Uncharacterized protein n=2 Tax=Acetobacter oeni TaxID=304077 RepID=A0A511XHH9_9PROT|nr:hypothetical protein [Acetobacter oeni]GEN62405.1 hypothetical protein AOE01nite_06290 [Acetobacter oeni]